MTDVALTYSDVHLILALVDAWPEGHLHFRRGDLDADVAMLPQSCDSSPNASSLHDVKSPAVGMLSVSLALNVGDRVEAGEVLATIKAAECDTVVHVEGPGGLVRYVASDQSFVEYGQVIAVLEPETNR